MQLDQVLGVAVRAIDIFVEMAGFAVQRDDYVALAEKPPFLEFEPASAVKFDPDLTVEYRVKLT